MVKSLSRSNRMFYHTELRGITQIKRSSIAATQRL